MLLLEVLPQVYHLSFGFNGKLRRKLSLVSAHCIPDLVAATITQGLGNGAAWQRTAPALAARWVISVSVLLPCVAQGSAMVESSRFLFLSQNLGRSLGAGRTSTYADWSGWRAGDVWQSLRLWLRYQVIASGKPRLPRSGLGASM